MISSSTGTLRRGARTALSIFSALTLLLSAWPEALPAAQAAGTITGTVYRDFNLNGLREAGEVGVAGVTVSAFDSGGASQGTATTGADGTYALAAGGTGPYRVEFTNIPEPYRPGPNGTNNGTTVQFVPDGGAGGIDLGVNDPNEYCQSLPFIATTCQSNGDPLAGGNAGDHAAVYSVPYGASGQNNGQANEVSLTEELGAIWGLAYRRSSSTLLVGAVTRRHSGFGPLGPAGLYAVTVNPATGARVSATPFVDLSSIGINVGANPHGPLPGMADQPSYDTGAFDAVGKTSLGDIELSPDERTVYLTNLSDRRVYAVAITNPAGALEVPTAADVTAYDILPLPAGAQACAAGDLRPWALRAQGDNLLVGLVCSGESTQSSANLYAYIISLDPATGDTTLATQFPLNYPRGCVSRDARGNCWDAEWRAWTPTMRSLCVDEEGDGTCDLAFDKHIIYPQPIVSSIDLDVDGALIISLLDRNAFQTGYQNYAATPAGPTLLPTDGSAVPTFAADAVFDGASGGDLLRLCRVGNGYQLESNGSCPGLPATAGANQDPAQGPGGGEWFWMDNHPVDGPLNTSVHDETSVGAAKVNLANRDVVATLYNPLGFGRVNTGGLGWFDGRDGTRPRSLELYNIEVTGSFGKAGGLGDLELLCLPAPIEIGNYVWLDSDRDGVQDPNETPFANIAVRLYTAGPDGDWGTSDDVLVATTTTDSVGRYYFTGLTPLTNYQVRIDTAQAPLIGYLLTVANSDASANGDSRDNDSLPQGLDAVITLTTGLAGENNHTYDFGFVEAPTDADLEYFKIEDVTANSVTLAWQTVSETDHFAFELVRADNAGFANSVVIDTTTESHPDGALYRVIDTPPGAGPWHYRLIEINTSGARTVMGTVSTGLSGLVVNSRLFIPSLLRR